MGAVRRYRFSYNVFGLGTRAEFLDVCRSRDRYGFSCYTVHGPFREAFAPVIERLR